MSKKPIVAVVGRPNVGKSTFFNKICGKRISIVKDVPGVTRDRIFCDAEWCGHTFSLVDTGGIELRDTDEMFLHIKEQAQLAIDMADVVVFFVDGKMGLVASDFDVANMLRRQNKPVLLVVNKLDNFELEKTYDFYQLQLGEPIPVSCEQSKGLGDLLDEIVKFFPGKNEVEVEERMNIAIVGKPNVGKSSLINRLLGFNRVIVSDIAGTTRDAIDTPFDYNGKKYNLIDTAGMRRKRSIEGETIESYSIIRTLAAVTRADVVFVVMDASEPLSEQDVKVAGYVHEQGKPSIIVMNKWDKVEKDTFTIEKYTEQLNIDLSFMSYYTAMFISASTGLRTEKLLGLAETVFANSSRRISTGLLNDVLNEAIALTPPPSDSGRRLKIYYSTQPEVNPPKFVVFVNDDRLVHFSYRRYLENSLRKAFDFTGTPIKMVFNNRKKDENE